MVVPGVVVVAADHHVLAAQGLGVRVLPMVCAVVARRRRDAHCDQRVGVLLALDHDHPIALRDHGEVVQDGFDIAQRAGVRGTLDELLVFRRVFHADHEMDFGALRVAVDVLRLLGVALLDEFEVAHRLLAVVVGEADRGVLRREAEPVAEKFLRALDVAAELRHRAQLDDSAFLLRLVVEPSALVQRHVEAVAAPPRRLYAVALHGRAETFAREAKAIPGLLDVVE